MLARSGPDRADLRDILAGLLAELHSVSGMKTDGIDLWCGVAIAELTASELETF